MESAEVLAAAAELVGAASPEASAAGFVGAGRCQAIPGSAALAEYPKEFLENVHAIPALAYFPPALS